MEIGALPDLYLINFPALCCNLAMASCLFTLCKRKWPPLCCCCRLKAHRLARRPKPPFWSQRTESRQQRIERRIGGHGAEVRVSIAVVMAKEQWGEDGREGERIKTWGSFAHQATRVPRSCPHWVHGARAEGLTIALPLAVQNNC